MEEHHEDMGRRILNELGAHYDHTRDDGVYVALFKLNYLRAVEHSEAHSIYVENDGLYEITREQRASLDERRFQLGGQGKPWTVHFNGLLIETRERRAEAKALIEKLLD